MSAVGQTLSINDEYKRRRAFAANRLVSRPPVRICAKPSLAAGKPRKLQLSYPDIAEYIELREYGMNVDESHDSSVPNPGERRRHPRCRVPVQVEWYPEGAQPHFARRPPRPRGRLFRRNHVYFCTGDPRCWGPMLRMTLWLGDEKVLAPDRVHLPLASR